MILLRSTAADVAAVRVREKKHRFNSIWRVIIQRHILIREREIIDLI